jgi:hypothetical protein
MPFCVLSLKSEAIPKNHSDKALNIKAEITAGGLNAILCAEPKVRGNPKLTATANPT